MNEIKIEDSELICEKEIAYYINRTEYQSGLNQKNTFGLIKICFSSKIWPAAHVFHKNPSS